MSRTCRRPGTLCFRLILYFHTMDTTIVYWGNIGIMEKNMETTIEYYNMVLFYCLRLQCLTQAADKSHASHTAADIESPL